MSKHSNVEKCNTPRRWNCIEYYINEDERTVVAVMNHAKEEAGTYLTAPAKKYMTSQLSEYCSWLNDFTPIQQAIKDIMKNSYRGIAKCAPEDKFDIETGKDIARARCLTAYYNDLWLAFNRAESYYDSLILAMNRRKKNVIDSYMHWLKRRGYNEDANEIYSHNFIMRETDFMNIFSEEEE